MFLFRAFILLALYVFVCAPALAIEDRADIEPNEKAGTDGGIAWKFTPGIYRETGGRWASDLNLRGSSEADTFWIGRYQRGGEFEQTRAGYERQLTVPFGRVIVSGQLASRGFLGGSVTLEASAASVLSSAAPFVVLLGWGRTNLKPYYNLNFDPNDSVLIGAGWRPDERTALTVFQVRDDRLRTGQRVTHFVLRQKTGARSRRTCPKWNCGKSVSMPYSTKGSMPIGRKT